MVMQDAISNNRWRKDKFAPTDAAKNVYWVLDDDSVTFTSEEQEIQEMEASMNLNEEDARSVAAALENNVAAAGFCQNAMANQGNLEHPGMAQSRPAAEAAVAMALADSAEGEGPEAAGKKQAGKGKQPGKGKKQGAAAGDGGALPVTVVPESPGDRARKMISSLASKAGDACTMVTKMKSLDASETLVKQLGDAKQNMEAQHDILTNIMETLEDDDPALDAATQRGQEISNYFIKKKQMAMATMYYVFLITLPELLVLPTAYYEYYVVR
jgi:hypothetical protein